VLPSLRYLHLTSSTAPTQQWNSSHTSYPANQGSSNLQTANESTRQQYTTPFNQSNSSGTNTGSQYYESNSSAGPYMGMDPVRRYSDDVGAQRITDPGLFNNGQKAYRIIQSTTEGNEERLDPRRLASLRFMSTH
jgi:hypothetical protein